MTTFLILEGVTYINNEKIICHVLMEYRRRSNAFILSEILPVTSLKK